MTTDQKVALFKLNNFCRKHKIEYAVTGTCALSILGVPTDMTPKDLDIIVYHIDTLTQDKFKELEALAGYKKEYSTSSTYTFDINGVKVNAIIDNESSYDDMDRELITINMVDEVEVKRHLISVQTMQYAWASKMKLGREKDMRYALNVINLLTLPMQ